MKDHCTADSSHLPAMPLLLEILVDMVQMVHFIPKMVTILLFICVPLPMKLVLFQRISGRMMDLYSMVQLADAGEQI